MIDETDIHRLDEIYVRKDYCNLVEAVKILHPRMYTTFIDKVQDL